MSLQDMDTLILKEGETLLLRPKRPFSYEELDRLQAVLKAANLRAVVVAHDIEMFVGVNVIAAPQEEAKEPTEDDIIAMRQEVQAAYEAGKFVQWCPTGDDPLNPDNWRDAHKAYVPHVFNWNNYRYRLRTQPQPG